MIYADSSIVIRLNRHEMQLVGQWIAVGQQVGGDEICNRIEALIRGHLQKISTRENGWIHLYIDPNDGRLWELTYPHGDWHGGGPPTLTCISQDDSQRLYPNLPVSSGGLDQ
jgi:hypothetical protein